MSKFNVGDKVRVVEKPDMGHYDPRSEVWWDPRRMASLPGTAGVVQGTAHVDFYRVQFRDIAWTIHQDDLELVGASSVHEAASTEYELRRVDHNRVALFIVNPVKGVPRHQWKAEWVADFHRPDLTISGVSGQVGGAE